MPPMLTKKLKPRPRPSPRQNKEDPTLIIESWDDVRTRLLGACRVFSHCQHDMDPVSHFLFKLYTIGFHHGALTTAGLTKENHKHIRASRKKIDHPVKELEVAVQTLFAEIVVIHRSSGLPENQN